MAKTKSTTAAAAAVPTPVPNPILKKIEISIRRLSAVHSTVRCLEHALLNQNAAIDSDAAVCLRVSVAGELTDIEIEWAKIMMELARRPLTPVSPKLL